MAASSLYLAIRTNNAPQALSLLGQDDAQIDLQYVDPQNSAAWTMLHWAAYHGNEELVSKLVETNRIPLSSCSPNVCTILHRAAQRGHLSVCWILLLSSQCSVDDRDASGNTPLHTAAAYGYYSIIRLFLNFGAGIDGRNNFLLSPLDVCTDDKCRSILKDALQGASDDDAEARRQSLIGAYTAKLSTLEGIVNGESDTDDIVELKKHLDEFKEFGLPQHVIDLGDKRVNWLEKMKEVSVATNSVQDVSPISTASIYESTVNTLQRLIKQMEVMLADNDGIHGEPPSSIVRLLQDGRAAIEIANADYWLSRTLDNCSDVKSSDTQSTSSSMAKLNEAIQRSNDLNGNKELIAQASGVLARLKADKTLRDALQALPTVRLPITDMTPKEEKSYWMAEDIGHIDDEFDGYPILPKDKEDYTWVESESLSTLRQAVQRLEDAITSAAESGVDESIVESARSSLATKSKEKKVLEGKNEENKTSAVADAKKAALKLLKKKRKKAKAKA